MVLVTIYIYEDLISVFVMLCVGAKGEDELAAKAGVEGRAAGE